jgi:thermitase
MKLIGSALKLSSVRVKRTGRTTRLLAALLLLLTLLVSFSAQAEAAPVNDIWGQDARFAKGSFKPGEVVVKFREPAGGKRVNNLGIVPDSLMSDALVQPFNLSGYKALFNMPGNFVYYVDPQVNMGKLVTALSLDPQVEFAEPNYIFSYNLTPNDPLYNQTYTDPVYGSVLRQWYLTKLGMESVWDTTTGNNQVVAVLDTGVNPFHEDLLNKVIQDRAYDFIQNKYVVATTASTDIIWDDNGHGTAVAGIIAAGTNNGVGIAGMNWNSLLLSVKVLDANGQGTATSVGQGIVYATDNQARIINMSLGSETNSKILEGAVQYAQSKGVLLVASAGNSPDAKPNFPAAFPNVIAVGATDIHNKITSFSSYGSYISVVAPGQNIFTTWCDFLTYTPATLTTSTGDFYDTVTNRVYKKTTLTSSGFRPDCVNPNPTRYPPPPVLCNNTDTTSCFYNTPTAGGDTSGTNTVTSRTYLYIDGTSFAAPIVTGLASLALTVRPDIPNTQLKTLIESTAVDVGPAGRDNYSGYGLVNGAALINTIKGADISGGRNSVLQGTVTGANFNDVIMNLDPPNQNINLNGAGGYRFDRLGAGVYNLRLAVPKRGIVLGPVKVYPNGRSDNVLNVNFDVASGSIYCGDGTVCPGNQNSSPGQPPTVPIPPAPPLSPNSSFFAPAAPLPGATYFVETGHNLSGGFRDYWNAHGGLAIFGFPLSEEFTEVSATDGRTYTVQYFQRNRFEFHPENSDPNRVLLGLLGSELTRGRNFAPGAPIPNTSTSQYFPETQHTLTDRFLAYWKAHGGLAIFGYPISEPIQEGNFQVQYFERNRFEYHPENAGTQYEVLLGLLGTDLARSRGYIR